MCGAIHEIGTLFYQKRKVPEEAKKAKEELLYAIDSNEPITIDGKKFECYTNEKLRAVEKVVHRILKLEGSIENPEELLVLGMKNNGTNIINGLTYYVHFNTAKALASLGNLLVSSVRIPVAIIIREDRIKNPYFLFHEIGHVLCCKDTRFLSLEKKVRDLEEIVADLFALYALCEANQNNSESVKKSAVLCLIQNHLKKEPYLNHREWYECGKEYFARLQQNQDIGMLLSQKFDMLVTDATKIIKKRKRKKKKTKHKPYLTSEKVEQLAKLLQIMNMP